MIELERILSHFKIAYDKDVPLKDRTWIHRGGLARYFIKPNNESELKLVAGYLYENSVPFLVLGQSSNVYIKNSSDFMVVLSTMRCNKYVLEGNSLFCETGVPVARLAHEMIQMGVKGFESLTELPGTVGAALINNSTCEDNSLSALLVSAKVLLPDRNEVVFCPDDFGFKYRSSVFKRKEVDGIVLSVNLKVSREPVEMLIATALKNKEKRNLRLGPKSMNLGCIVDNPFSLGKMDTKYYLPFVALNAISKVLMLSHERRTYLINSVLCRLSNCTEALPYISKNNSLVFIWSDENADEAFPVYLEYMRKVYKTDQLEIEIL